MAAITATPAPPRARHGRLHDGAAARHAAGARAQPALQQDPARARRGAHRRHGADALRARRGPGRRSSRSAKASTTSGCSTDSCRTRTCPRRCWTRRPREWSVDLERRDLLPGTRTIIVTAANGMATWREKLFVLMARNAVARPRSSACRPSAWWSWACRWRCNQNSQLPTTVASPTPNSCRIPTPHCNDCRSQFRSRTRMPKAQPAERLVVGRA